MANTANGSWAEAIAKATEYISHTSKALPERQHDASLHQQAPEIEQSAMRKAFEIAAGIISLKSATQAAEAKMAPPPSIPQKDSGRGR